MMNLHVCGRCVLVRYLIKNTQTHAFGLCTPITNAYVGCDVNGSATHLSLYHSMGLIHSCVCVYVGLWWYNAFTVQRIRVDLSRFGSNQIYGERNGQQQRLSATDYLLIMIAYTALIFERNFVDTSCALVSEVWVADTALH